MNTEVDYYKQYRKVEYDGEVKRKGSMLKKKIKRRSINHEHWNVNQLIDGE